MSKIRTTLDPKPIPQRHFDWVATRDSWEPGLPIGYGCTEAEAIIDLLNAEEDRDDHD